MCNCMMAKLYLRKINPLLFVILFGQAFCLLSQVTAIPHDGVEQIPLPNNCETNVRQLDKLAQDAKNNLPIIIIARPEDGEKSLVWANRRLHNMKTYLIEFWGYSRESIITGIGEKSTGHSKLEIYNLGKLTLTLQTRRNENIYLGSCDSTSEKDKLFYNSRRKKRNN